MVCVQVVYIHIATLAARDLSWMTKCFSLLHYKAGQ